MVVFTVLAVYCSVLRLVVFAMLDVYCSLPCVSQLRLLYILSGVRLSYLYWMCITSMLWLSFLSWIAVHWFSLLCLVYIGVCCVFITMLDVNVSVLWFSRLCWLYDIVPYGCHGHVGCTLQCAAVIFTVYYIGCMVHSGVDVITLLDVYCVVPLLSQQSLLYIAVQYGCYDYLGGIMQYAVVVIYMFDVYCNVLRWSLLCWLYIALCCVFHHHVALLLCNVLWWSILCLKLI